MSEQAKTILAPEVILALDVPEINLALDWAKKLSGKLTWLKVGLELFSLAGPNIVRQLKELGYKIFLDLKLHDIPNTVAQATKALSALEVDMLSIHLQGGSAMSKAALEMVATSPKPALIFGVTVLTSLKEADLAFSNLGLVEYAQTLAKNASDWGLNGLICSAVELVNLKKVAPNLAYLCPGIRPNWAKTNDQARIATPKEAMLAGANFLVIGRPILTATDPLEAIDKIFAELQS